MITARLFARLREQAGTDREQLDLAGFTVADVYERELDRAVNIISALIPILIIVLIAIVVALIVFSILSAVFEMTHSLQLRPH